jgi:molybdopterin-guanine dinucleotide biosynthesis protein|nr:hypothetical protein [Muribaculum intestinale]
MARAYSVNEAMSMKKKTIPFTGAWADAFGNPERKGVWFVWGQSGNGKTSFMMQLSKELCKFGKVAYNSLEQGVSLSMQQTLAQHGMIDVNRRFVLLNREPIAELSERLAKPKSADFVIIDSFQYTQMGIREYMDFVGRHPNKLIIFVSQADGRNPDGRTARKAMFDADQKIFVEGFRAMSKGRFFGPVGSYTVWEEGAERYWGRKADR